MALLKLKGWKSLLKMLSPSKHEIRMSFGATWFPFCELGAIGSNSRNYKCMSDALREPCGSDHLPKLVHGGFHHL